MKNKIRCKIDMAKSIAIKVEKNENVNEFFIQRNNSNHRITSVKLNIRPIPEFRST